MTEQELPFERRLAAALGALRPIHPAPSSIRDRVLALPDDDRRRTTLTVRRFAGVAASVAAVALTVAATRFPAAPYHVGASGPTPRVLGVDPTVEGPGLITSMVPTLPLIATLIVAAAIVMAVVRLRQKPRRRTDLVAAAIAVAAALAAVGLVAHHGPGDAGWNGFGPVLGFRQISTPGVDDQAGQHLETLFEDAKPGAPFAVVFVVGNQGPLTVRLEGVREDPDAATRILPRWTALAIGSDPNAIGQPLNEVAPFVPTDIESGKYVVLYLIGKASACSIGDQPYAADQAFMVRGPDIELAYSIFGLTSTTTYHMPMVLEEPVRNGCTG